MTRLPVVLLLLASAPLAAQGPSLEQRVLVLERRVKALSELVLRMDTLQREVQQLRGEIEVQNHAVDALKQRQRDLYLDLDSRLQGGAGTAGAAAATAATPVAPPAASPAPAPVAPVPQPSVTTAPPPATTTAPQAEQESAYQQAYAILRERRYDEAKSAFSDYLSRYPGGSFADNAQYWLAEASYVTRDFDRAQSDFAKVIEGYPESPKVPGAMLKTGYILFDKNQPTAARETLNALIKRYPASSAARLAQEFMRKKGL